MRSEQMWTSLTRDEKEKVIDELCAICLGMKRQNGSRNDTLLPSVIVEG